MRRESRTEQRITVFHSGIWYDYNSNRHGWGIILPQNILRSQCCACECECETVNVTPYNILYYIFFYSIYSRANYSVPTDIAVVVPQNILYEL